MEQLSAKNGRHSEHGKNNDVILSDPERTEGESKACPEPAEGNLRFPDPSTSPCSTTNIHSNNVAILSERVARSEESAFPLLPLLLCLLFAITSSLCSAQSDTGGSIAGQVSGVSGNLFRALVTIRNNATGIHTLTLSDARGNFRFPEVAPGTYSVRVTAPGAAPWRTYNVTVEVGRITLIAPQMTVALLDYDRNQPEHGPQADLTPAVRSNVEPEFIDSLPSSTGSWSDFAAIAAGSAPVIAPDDSGTSALSFRGLSPLMNGITVDGADNTLAFRGIQRGSIGGGYAMPRSAISQFQVAASNFSAEYGRAAGGVISSVTRSGSNTLHLEASFYDRDASWGAANAYTKIMQPQPAGTTVTSAGQPVLYLNGQPVTYIDTPYRAPDRRLQFGLNAGGPIRRDRLFWFIASEYHNRSFPGIARANEPEIFFAPPSAQTIQTLATRIAASTNPIYTGCAASPPDLNAQALCAYSAVLNQLAGILGNVPRTARQLNFFPKIDWRVSDRIHFTGQYTWMRRNSPNGILTGASETDGIGSFGNSSSSENAAVARVDYFFTPNLVDNLRFQYSRTLLSRLAATSTSFEQQFAANTYARPPEISIDRSAGFTFGTLASQAKSQYPLETRQQLFDAVTWIHSRHAFRIGYDYNHVTDAVSGVSNQNGEYSYSSLANFVADYLAPSHCDGTTTGTGSYPCYSWFRQTLGSSVWQFSTADYAAFFADDWKLAPRLTLSLGLRYDYERLPDTNSLVANPAIPQTAYLPHDRNNFGPRAGFAWDIFGSGHTVLRGGFGVYYARVSNATVFSALTSTGSPRSARSYFYRPLDTGAPPFPYVFAANETPYTDPNAPDAIQSAPNAVYFDRRFQNPQVDQASLSLQQELGGRTAVTLSYLASFAHELPQFLDRNIDLANVATLNYNLDFSANPNHNGPLKSNFTTPFYFARVNPAYGSITGILSESDSRYQAAVFRVTRRTRRNIDLNVAYTYSHAIDDNQNSSTFANFNNFYDPANLALEHGTSDFDIRQRASGGIVAHTPWRLDGFIGSLLNGYMLSTYGEWRTGLPYTMRTMGSVPVSECFYEQYENYGGVYNGGANCVTDTVNSGGLITGPGVPIPAIGASLNGSGGEDLTPQVGRNTFRYPGTVGLDVRAGKRTTLTDRIAVEFFAEAFNVLNHPNVTNIQTIGYSIANDPTHTNTAQLSYLTGLEKNSTQQPTVGGTPLIPSPTAGFGDVTDINSNAFFHARRIQLGCKFIF
ncbi:MAG TPA: TonB-dependent receptor [Acidobacteriaceae bacterium]|nr:TonB-dependent receptor [Acidobacteriaceae bacterium]